MNLTKILLYFCTIFSILFFKTLSNANPTPENDKLLLQEAIDIGLNYSPELKSSQAAFMATKGLEEQAGYWDNPILGIQAENIAGTGPYSRLNSAEYTYSITKSVDITGKRFVRKSAATQVKNTANSDFLATRLNVMRNIYVAYINSISQQISLQVVQEQELLAKQILTIVSKRVKLAREAEISKIKADVAYESAIISTNQQKIKLKSAQQNLAKLLGLEFLDKSLDSENFFNIIKPQPIMNYQIKLSDSPLLKKFYYKIKEQEFNFELERVQKISNPTVKIGIKELHAPGEQAMIASLSIPLPIFNNNHGNISHAQEKLNQARNDEIQARLSLEQSLIQEWNNWQMHYETAEKLQTETLPTAQKALEVAKSGYDKGRFTYLEVLDAQRTLFDIKSKYFETLRQYHIAKANIDLITTPINNSKTIKDEKINN